MSSAALRVAASVQSIAFDPQFQNSAQVEPALADAVKPGFVEQYKNIVKAAGFSISLR